MLLVRCPRLFYLLLATLVLAPPRAAPQEPAARAAERPSPEPIIGLPAEDAFTFTITQPHFRTAIPIELRDARDTLPISVRASPLRSERGTVARVRSWLTSEGLPEDTTRGQLRLAARDGAELHLEASLAEPGTYRGSFSIITPQSRITRAYRVEWSRRGQPVEVTGGGALATELSFVCPTKGFTVPVLDRVCPPARITIPFTLHDTTGSVVALHRPALADLRQQRGSDTSFAVTPGPVTLHARGDTSALDSLRVGANSSHELELRIAGTPRTAGVYTGTLRFAGPDFTPFSVSFTAYARSSLWLAFWVILLGILIAEMIRWYQDRARPRLGRQARASALFEELEILEERIARGGDRPAEREVIEALRARIWRLFSAAERGAPAAADAELADMEARLEMLPAWVTLDRETAALEPPPLREELGGQLRPVRDYLLSTAVDEEERARAQETLASLPDGIRQRRSEQLLQGITGLEALFAAESEARAGDEEFLRTIAPPIRRDLDLAREHAEAGRLEQGQAAFDEARQRFIRSVADALRQRLNAAPPGWIASDRWGTLRAAVEPLLEDVETAGSAEAKLRALERAQREYLVRLAVALDERATSILEHGKPGEEERTHLARAREAAQRVQQLAATDPRAAAAEVATMEKAWNAYQKAKPAQMRGTAAATAPDPAAIEMLPAGAAHGGRTRMVAPARRLPSARSLRDRIRWLDWVITGTAALIATVLGIQLLWEPNVTWGTGADLLTAFLWGLGLQAAGNQTLGGLANLVGRVGGRKEEGD